MIKSDFIETVIKSNLTGVKVCDSMTGDRYVAGTDQTDNDIKLSLTLKVSRTSNNTSDMTEV